MVRHLTREEVQVLIEEAQINKSFFKAADSLWFRFSNYDSNPPMGLVIDDKVVCVAFVSKLKRESSINLYDIVAIQEGKGFGTKMWKEILVKYTDLGVQRIKFRALWKAIEYYKKLGIYFWGFDGTSFTVNQPLFSTIEETLKWRDEFISGPISVYSDKLLEDKAPSKKNTPIIDSIKEDLGIIYYMNNPNTGTEELDEW